MADGEDQLVLEVDHNYRVLARPGPDGPVEVGYCLAVDEIQGYCRRTLAVSCLG